MDSQQAMALCLDHEVTSIRHSVTTGLMLLRKAKHIDDSFEPCLILLSIGFEKLLKLSLGLSVYAETREWVSNKELRDAGHHIDQLWEKQLGHIRKSAAMATNPSYIETALAELDTLVGLNGFITSLAEYALNGRFYYQDVLSGQIPLEDSAQRKAPIRIWHHAEMKIIETSPELVRLCGHAGNDLEAQYEYSLAIRNQSANEIEAAYELVRMAWAQNLYGLEGRRFATALKFRHSA